MPDNLYEFASNAEHYSLTSRVSLHDAWLEKFVMREMPAIGSGGNAIAITASYLGPFHDRRIHLTYHSVTGYSFFAPPNSFHQPPIQTGHGDLLIHEVRVIGQDVFEHELQFSKGAVFIIQFQSFSQRIDMIETRD